MPKFDRILIALFVIVLLSVIALSLSYWPSTPESRESQAKRVYFAGALFSFQEIVGNAVLAAAIDKESEGRYVCILPQNYEQDHTQSVRDQDLRLVKSCDALIANANGLDLDSGTVVEFMTAIMYEKPALVLRTDFRGFICGPGDNDQQFNPMIGNFPGAKYINIDAMAIYKSNGNSSSAMTSEIARSVVAGLDSLFYRQVQSPQVGLDVDRILGI